MLTEQTIRGLVKEPVCESHIKFLQHYLNNKSESTFLNGVKSYLLVTDKSSGRAAAVSGSRLIKRYKNVIRLYLNLLKH